MLTASSLVIALCLHCFYRWCCCDSIWISYRQAVRTGIRYHQHTLLSMHTYEHDNYNELTMIQRSMDDESHENNLVAQTRATNPFLSYSSSNFNLKQSFVHSKLSSIPSTRHHSTSSSTSSYNARPENNDDLSIPNVEQTTSNGSVNINILTTTTIINTTIASSSNITTVDTIIRSIPKHVGFIVDGNGRWAVENGFTRIEGHKQGANVTVEIVKTVFIAGVDYITLYLFSSENWKRPSIEIANIFELLNRYVNSFSAYLKENYIELVMIGDEDRIPYITKELIRGAGYKPSSNQDDSRDDISSYINDKPYRRRVLTLALSYGGRQDIIQACKSILTTKIIHHNNNNQANNNNNNNDNSNNNNKQVAMSLEDIDEVLFTKHLYLGKLSIPDPDLIIRTSGESRLSNFLLWESSYAEFISISPYCE